MNFESICVVIITIDAFLGGVFHTLTLLKAPNEVFCLVNSK